MADAAVERADIIVGVASYNSEATVGAVMRGVREGLSRHFPGATACVVLADGGSTDDTLARAREEVTGGCHLVTTAYKAPIGEPLRLPYHGLVGRSEAIRTIFETALTRSARVCTVIDAGLSSLPPDWVPRLIQPVLDDTVDYASAYYLRSPYEGALTKCIVYPMFRTLYGVRLHQPATGEFGCSARLVRHYLEQDFWTTDGAETGIDLWLAADASANGHRICESALGVRAQAHRPSAADVRTIVTQVVGALFADVEQRANVWQRARSSAPLPVVGTLPSGPADPIEIDVTEHIEFFRLGYTALRDIWAWVLPPKVIMQLRRLSETPEEQFRIDDEQWAHIIYDFALAYHLRAIPRDHVLGSLTPLYHGWLASFVLEMGTASTADADARVDRLADTFEREKAYLISRWRWPDRFRS